VASDGASFSAAAKPLSCDFGAMKTYAGDFFSASNDVVFGLISSMKSAYGSGGATAATPLGLDILTEISKARLTSRQVLSPATKLAAARVAGGMLAQDVALCSTLGALDAATASTAITSGIFEVRGTGPDQTAAVAKPDVFPRWGVESKTSAWPTFTGIPRYLLYGTAGAATTELGGEPQSVDGFVGYDVASLPSGISKSGMRVGICVKTTITDANLNGTAVNRLIHSGVVEANQPPNFCSGAPTASLSTSAWFASLAHRTISVFSPSSLFAQGRDDLDLIGFTGGGPSSWSPMAFGKIVGQNVNASFKTQPKDGFIFTAIPSFTVHVNTAATPGHSLEGVKVTVSVFGNNGEPAGAFVNGTVTVETNADGDALFDNVIVNKAGGFTITATGSFSGVGTQNAISKMFHIKNKTAP